jgi:hypothetical protein
MNIDLIELLSYDIVGSPSFASARVTTVTETISESRIRKIKSIFKLKKPTH